MRKLSKILGIVAIVLITIGIIFRILHYPGEIILLVGTLTFVLGFAIPYTIDRITAQSRRALQISTAILTIAISLIVVGGVLKILHLPFSGHALLAGGILLPVYLIFFARESEGRKLQLRKDRQLAAILFTDIVGFTAMMGEDEEKALRVLEQNRKIQKTIIRKHRGKWLKEMGDGSLVIFYTATEAITAAIEIQHLIQESGGFNVRMGIHISEIVFTDDDVFGDGVNVASRISDKASANEICISESVYQNIRNREDLKIDFLGEMEFKNVSYKLTVFRIDASREAEGAKIRKLAN